MNEWGWELFTHPAFECEEMCFLVGEEHGNAFRRQDKHPTHFGVRARASDLAAFREPDSIIELAAAGQGLVYERIMQIHNMFPRL